MERMLDAGCGRSKTAGAVGLDRRPFPGVDVLADLSAPLPFGRSVFDRIRLFDVLEHVPDVVAVMEEVWRVGRPGCRVDVRAPFFAGRPRHDDPTHLRGFTHRSLDYFCPGRPYYDYGYTGAAFELLSVRYEADHDRRFALDRALVSLANRFPDVYERRFAYLFPVGSVHFTLAVRKPAPERGAP